MFNQCAPMISAPFFIDSNERIVFSITFNFSASAFFYFIRFILPPTIAQNARIIFVNWNRFSGPSPRLITIYRRVIKMGSDFRSNRSARVNKKCQ